MTPKTLSVIGGYLGAGKTTQINNLLRSSPGTRMAILVNDFGEINIDATLISSVHKDTIELTNGCICCQITDAFGETMRALALRPDIDHILCEVSGVGNPTTVASWGRFPGLTPGPVVVCADATTLPELLTDQFVADVVQQQLTAADTILITKTDIASETAVERTVGKSREVNRGAHLIIQGKPGSGNVHADLLARNELTEKRDKRGRTVTTPGAYRAQESTHGTHQTRFVKMLGPVNTERAVEILEDSVSYLVRAKGVVMDSEYNWVELQLSGGRVTSERLSLEGGEPKNPGIVLISKGPRTESMLESVCSKLSNMQGV